jgi:hypothetical protein
MPAAAPSAVASPTTGAPLAADPSPAPTPPLQSSKPTVDLEATRALYDRATDQLSGIGSGKVEWRENFGILLHPGESPTEVAFDVSDREGQQTFVFWISGLPENALSNPGAGTAGFELLLDGQSQGRFNVDRYTNQNLEVNLTGVSEVRIIVDDADGDQLCDWFFMGLQ